MENFNEMANGLETEDAKKAEYNAKVRETRKQNLTAWRQAFDQSVVETNGAIKDALSTRSNDIVVVKALTFGEPKYIVRKDESGNETFREPVPNVVGYEVQNVSSTPINAYTTKCQLVDGVYVKNPVECVIAPNQIVAFRKVDFVTLLTAPEFSFTAANGKLTTRTFTGTTQADLEAFLEKHNFLFTDAKVGDMIKQISTSVDGQDVVIPEYKDVFAYLENKAEKKTRQSQKQPSQTAQELAANYVRRLITGPMPQ